MKTNNALNIASSANKNIQNNTIGAAKTFLFIVLAFLILFLLFKGLKKLGLLGQTDEEKNDEKLSAADALQDLNKDNALLTDAKKILKTNTPTPAQLNTLLPNKNKFGQYVLTLMAADGAFNDDETAVYNVFKSMYSQYEISTFATTFKQVKGMDLYLYLKSFLDTDEMSEIYKIVSAKRKA